MILLQNLYNFNYKNLKSANFKNFGDLNIFIGPNNCGKTSILNSINILSNIQQLQDFSFNCERCSEEHVMSKSKFKDLEIHPVGCILDFNAQYLRKNKITIIQEYSDKIFSNDMTPYLNKFLNSIESFVGNLVFEDLKMKLYEKGYVPVNKLDSPVKLIENYYNVETFVEYIVDFSLQDLKSRFNLSEYEINRIRRALKGCLYFNENNRISDAESGISILLCDNGKEAINKIIDIINKAIRDIIYSENNYFDSKQFSNIVKNAKREYFSYHIIDESKIKCNPFCTLTLKQHYKGDPNTKVDLVTPHLSFFCIPEVCEFLRDQVCYIEDDRLRIYKNKNLDQYIKDKNLTSEQTTRLMNFICKVADPKIKDCHHNMDLVKVDGFVTSISEQGSGVRSLICLATDILSTKENNILLMDEPELGLNPSAKKEFLKFLIEESKSKQIFITTHDPTFVNPTIWNEYETKTSVYLYSLKDEVFIKVDLKQNNVDPSTFGGYLPHTTSLKKIHIYVEGASDVYTFQEFLRKYLINKGGHWAEKWNNIGIYHLNGDNWQHMLYTLPKHPYQCVVVLDGDKKESAMSVCKQYNKLMNHQDFEFCLNGLDDLERILLLQDSNGTFPVYCLEKETIEDYFREYIEDPDEHNKVKDNPEIVRSMEYIPEEFERIFELITGKLK